MNDCRISGHSDTRFTVLCLLRTDFIKFEDLKIAIFCTPKGLFYLNCEDINWYTTYTVVLHGLTITVVE